jgi:glycosyl transferase family 87
LPGGIFDLIAMTERSTAISSPADRPTFAAWFFVALLGVIGIGLTVPAIRSVSNDHLSDVLRQWRTSQYVLTRVNPYPVALAALQTKFGAPDRSRTPEVYGIPRQGPHPNTRKDIGPPEATYPPTSALLLAFTIGPLRPEAVTIIWNVLNIVLFCLIGRELIRLQHVQNAKLWSVLFLLSLGLLWPATTAFFARGQFSLIVLWSVLVAERIGEKRSWLSGILYALALIKPSLGLPFLLAPLIRRRWKSLAWTAVIEAVLLLAAAWFLRASPVSLISEWLSVGRYFLIGLYTVQEIINDLHLTAYGGNIAIPLAVVAGAVFLIYRSEANRTIAMLSVIAAIWTYHYPYDFVVLICVMAFLFTPLDHPSQWDVWQWSGLVAMVMLGIALSDFAVRGETAPWRLMRWGGRISLVWIIVSIARAKRSNAALRSETEPVDKFSSARWAPGL